MNENIRKYFEEMKETISRFEEEGTEMPFTAGDFAAYRAYEASIENESSEFECNALPDDYETEDFLRTLKKAGAETIAITCCSTALMEALHRFADFGCTVDGLCTVTKNIRWKGTVKIPAIRIRL